MTTPMISRPPDSGTFPPGWYPDPALPGQLRYWDGTAWTQNIRPAGGPAVYPTVPGQSVGNGLSIAAIVLGCVAFVFLPPIFGTIGLILAAIGRGKGERLATPALVVAAAGLVLGMGFGLLAMGTVDTNPGGTSPQPTAQPTDSAWQGAIADLNGYRAGKDGTWSQPIPGYDGPTAVVVQGSQTEILIHGYVGGSWREVEGTEPSWTTRMTDFTFEVADTTGLGRSDLVLSLTDTQGDRGGTVVFGDGTFATFLHEGEMYGFWEGLTWNGSRLTDDEDTTFTYVPGQGAFEANTPGANAGRQGRQATPSS